MAGAFIFERGRYFMQSDDFRSCAGSPGAGRFYFGRHTSVAPEKRLNLLVARPDADGIWRVPERCYRDSPDALPSGLSSAPDVLARDPRYSKLYLGIVLRPTSPVNSVLVVHDLDAAGDPRGAPRSYALEGVTSATSMAFHPTRNVLYFGGTVGVLGAIAVIQLDAEGWPLSWSVDRRGDVASRYTLAVHPGGRVYVGCSSAIQIENLQPDGSIDTAVLPRSIDFASYSGTVSVAVLGNRLFWAKDEAGGDPWQRTLTSLDLDDNGDPVSSAAPVLVGGEPVPVRVPWQIPPTPATPPYYATFPHLFVDHARGALVFAQDLAFDDFYDGTHVLNGSRLVRYQANAIEEIAASYHLMPYAMALLDDGTPLVVAQRTELDTHDNLRSRTGGQQIRLTVEATPVSGSVTGVDLTDGLGNTVSFDAPFTEWKSLDPLLRGQGGFVFLSIVPRPASVQLSRLHMRAEIAFTIDPATSLPIVAVTCQSESVGTNFSRGYSHALRLVMPGYGADPFTLGLPDTTTLDEARRHINFLDAHSARYLARAAAVAVPAAERARFFPISCGNLFGGGQANETTLRNLAGTLAGLGFNTVCADRWGAIPDRRLATVLVDNGLVKRAIGSIIINPPAVLTPALPFGYALDTVRLDQRIAAWRAELDQSLYYAPALSYVVEVFLLDESGWYYPAIFDLDPDPTDPAQRTRLRVAMHTAFVNFLRSGGFTPAYFGAASWDAVAPIDLRSSGALAGPTADIPIKARRLFYWTTRFFPDAFARGTAIVRRKLLDALEAGLPPSINPLPIFIVDLENDDLWYSAGAGSPDLRLLALRGVQQWTEESVSSSDDGWTYPLQTWSFRADMMRSMAALADGRFGGFIRGNIQHQHVHGTSYRLFSLIGKGAKNVDFFQFGPKMQDLNPADSWSDDFDAYEWIAEALHLVGSSEPLVYDGQPILARVALLLPGSTCWDPDDARLHVSEVFRLHVALAHASLGPVDLIDSSDIIHGRLRDGGYRVLYMTAPNIPTSASLGLRSWVEAGGHLVVTPSALVRDQYDNPLPAEIDAMLGLRARARHVWPDPGLRADSRRIRFPSRFAGLDTLTVRGPVTWLRPTTATVVGQLGPMPVLTRHPVGSGSVLVYGFFPGLTYWLTPNHHQRFIPTEWGADERAVVVQAVRESGFTPPDSSSPQGVEICRLQSRTGIALVLLNWGGVPIPGLQLDVAATRPISSVRSAKQGALTHSVSGGRLRFSVDLVSVDVILIGVI